jgi:Uma2 family endonuclease
MVTIATERFSIEEYLQREEQADSKSEYIDGRIIPMAGGTTNHNQIAGNIYAELHFAFKQRDCRVYMGDVRLWIPERRIFRYPDVMVVLGEPVYFENRRDTITDPVVIVEVLSPSTENYDREGKFAAYRTLPTLREYVLIGQTSVYAEKFERTGEKQWSFREYSTEDRQISVDSVQITLDFSDIYHKIDLNLP